MENAQSTSAKGNHLRRLDTLALMIYSLLRIHQSRLTELAKVVCPDLDFESRVKKFKRLVINEYVDAQTFFIPFLAKLLASLASRKQVVFAIDGSPVGSGCVCLMISLIWRKRAIPLCWMVRKGKKGHFPVKMHLKLLEALSAILPADCPVTILGDGEFSKVELLEFCQNKGWDVVCRTAKNRQVTLEHQKEKLSLGSSLYPEESHQTAWFPNVKYTAKKYGPVHVFCHHEPTHDAPWYLVSNIDHPPTVVRLYRKRFGIETLFGDLKSRGFNIHKSKLRHPERLEKLLIAVCLAFIFTILAGVRTHRFNPTQLKKIFRQDQAMQFSIFSKGKMIWDFFLLFPQSRPPNFKELLLNLKSVRL